MKLLNATLNRFAFDAGIIGLFAYWRVGELNELASLAYEEKEGVGKVYGGKIRLTKL